MSPPSRRPINVKDTQLMNNKLPHAEILCGEKVMLTVKNLVREWHKVILYVVMGLWQIGRTAIRIDG